VKVYFKFSFAGRRVDGCHCHWGLILGRDGFSHEFICCQYPTYQLLTAS
jgi:hypothetical protein